MKVEDRLKKIKVEDRLKKIKERCNAATEGPIVGSLYTEDSKSGFGIYQRPDEDTHSFIGDFVYKKDAEFYSHAHADVPMLLEMVVFLLDTDHYKKMTLKTKVKALESIIGDYSE